MQYGEFESDVRWNLVSVRELYPGCGHVLEHRVTEEEFIENYTPVLEGPHAGCHIGLDPTGKCASCV